MSPSNDETVQAPTLSKAKQAAADARASNQLPAAKLAAEMAEGTATFGSEEPTEETGDAEGGAAEIEGTEEEQEETEDGGEATDETKPQLTQEPVGKKAGGFMKNLTGKKTAA